MSRVSWGRIGGKWGRALEAPDKSSLRRISTGLNQ